MGSTAPRTARPGLCIDLDGSPAIDVPRGAYGCLLGPAGSGKAALLRRVCGLDRARWAVTLDGHSLGSVPPHRRRIALLARGGSLAPFGSLRAAVRFRLAAARVPRAMRAARLVALAQEFDLDLAADPARLNLDARLRGRLAVALAADPVLLVANDPLAECDDPAAMIELFRTAQRRRGLTVLHATRRHAEAYALADHLILLEAGRVLQAGPTARVYDRPDSLAIARRLGPANVLPGCIEEIDNDLAMVRLDCGPVIEADAPAWDAHPPVRCRVLLRPERVSVSRAAASELGGAAIPAVLRDITGGGDMLRLAIAIGADAELAVLRPAALGAVGLAAGQTVSIAWQSRHALVFPDPP